MEADDQNGIVENQHDAAGQLTGRFRGQVPLEEYRYDDVGNLYPRGQARTYGPGGRLEQVDRTTYVYDERARLIEKTTIGDDGDERRWTYSWNGKGLLHAVVTPGPGLLILSAPIWVFGLAHAYALQDAAQLTLDSAFLRELDLPTLGRQEARLASGASAPLVYTRLPELTLGEATLYNLPAEVMDIRRYAPQISGFIGTNLADRFLSEGTPVTVYDDLSRPGVADNLAWLQEQHGDLLHVEVADVRDPIALRQCVSDASAVYHFAAQVAVTTSLELPVLDFGVNARGTLNLLEELRRLDSPPPLVFTSTNKVYGALADVALEQADSRYQPVDRALRSRGISEDRSLDFHSPYGCSKGAADAYVTDYARTYRMPATVFRMSCIYGPHQRGTEDQGWFAHFLISVLKGEPLAIFGDGLQVRDLLYVEDLVEALRAAVDNIEVTSGKAFNIGGGPANAVSLMNVLRKIRDLTGIEPEISFAPWRVGDQRYYVSDTTRFRRACGWSPTVSVDEGLEGLYDWLMSQERIAENAEALA